MCWSPRPSWASRHRSGPRGCYPGRSPVKSAASSPRRWRCWSFVKLAHLANEYARQPLLRSEEAAGAGPHPDGRTEAGAAGRTRRRGQPHPAKRQSDGQYLSGQRGARQCHLPDYRARHGFGHDAVRPDHRHGQWCSCRAGDAAAGTGKTRRCWRLTWEARPMALLEVCRRGGRVRRDRHSPRRIHRRRRGRDRYDHRAERLWQVHA